MSGAPAKTPTTRRSTRIASRDTTPAVPASLNLTNTSTTPGRAGGRTRGRTSISNATPHTQRAGAKAAPALPALAAGRSYAYGATGRLSVPGTTTSPTGNLTGAVAAARNSAKGLDGNGVEEAEDENDDQQEEVQETSAKTIVQPAMQPQAETSSPNTRSSRVVAVEHQPETAPTDQVDASISFSRKHEAGALSSEGLGRLRERHTALRDKSGQPQRAQATKNDGESRRSQWIKDHLNIAPMLRHIPSAVGWLFMGITLLMAVFAMYPQVISPVVGQFTTKPLYVDPEQHLQAIESKVMVRVMKFLIDSADLYSSTNKSIHKAVDKMQSEMDTFKATLPDYIVVRYDAKTNKYGLLDHFWQALDEKTSEEFNKGNIPWDNFVTRNEQLLGHIAQARLQPTVESAIRKTLDQYEVLSRDELMRHFRHVQSQIDVLNGGRDKALAALVERAEGQYLKKLEGKYLRALHLHWYLENVYTALHQVNFLSPKIGTTVDAKLTSPTLVKKLGLRQRIWRCMTSQTLPNGPITALQNWDEPGDCWCAAVNERAVISRVPAPMTNFNRPLAPSPEADNKGTAQLGVRLPFPVFPSEVVVEHPPVTGTLEPDTAPRFMELWVEVEDEGKRKEVAQAFETSNAPWPVGWPTGGCSERGGLPAKFVCAGRWEYEKWGWNHVQPHSLTVPFQELGVGVDRAVVRVTETWGKQYTCLYRVRLLGKMVQAEAV